MTILCNCNLVMSDDIEKYLMVYPDTSEQQLQKIFNIGTRCGCCLMNNSPVVKINLKNYLNNRKIKQT